MQCTSTTTADVYVAPSGQGTACSCGTPCALEAGRDMARTVAANASRDIIVQLADGNYRLGHTFALDATNSGPGGGHSIIYRAASGASPVVNGAIQVQGFAPLNGSSLIWVASVPSGTQARQLWVNGRRATRARGPDSPAGYTKTATGFALGDPSIASWPDRAQIEVVGTWHWQMYRCPVTSVNASAGLVLAQPCWANGLAAGGGFPTVAWLENALELLTSPGQFYLDSAGGKLYYAPRPGENLSSADVELPVVEALVNAAGSPTAPLHDVAFERITFAYGTWLAPSTGDGYIAAQASITFRGSPVTQQKSLANVTMHATHGVRFSSCTFTHLGGAGLAFEVGAQSNLVDSCRFDDISSNAIFVGDVTHTVDHHPNDPTLVVRDNTVQNSYVTRAGAEYYDAVGIFLGFNTNATIKKNELFDLPYTGISVGWQGGSYDVGGGSGYTTPTTLTNNHFQNNIVSHYMRKLFDGGALYTSGAAPGSTMNGNVISNQGNPYSNIYLDNGTQNWTITNNVVLVDAKQDVAQPDPNRSYWLYVQAQFNPFAKNNSITANFTNDATQVTQSSPIDPSNTVDSPTILVGGNLSSVASIIAAAGTTLRSPEVAGGKPVTASSAYDPGHAATAANNGNSYGGWASAGGDSLPWWQVDLGTAVAIDCVEVVSRWAIDDPLARRNYEVRASADPSFATYTVIGSVDRVGIPHQAIYAATVAPAVAARYVRIAKTVAESFFIGQVRVHGK